MTQTKERDIMTEIEQLEPASATVTTAPPAAPTDPARGTRLKKWRNRLIVLIMVVAAGLAGTAVVRSQASRASQLDLGELMLTSQPIPVETSLPGLVTSVDVKAGERVTTGQKLGSIRVTTTNSTGHAVLSQRTLKAPRSGVVVDDPLTIGSTLEPGTGFVTLYDPADLTLVTQVPLSYLHEVAPGMVATLTASGVPGSIHAVLRRAVPRIGTNQSDVTADHLELVFVAQKSSDVARLIPGLQFTGTIDTNTGREGTKPVVFVN
jgi:multidrug resistance efflux pump